MSADHPDVGSHCFEFICSIPCECGRVRNRIAFAMKAGDDPNFRLARMLMPGAVYRGIVHGVIDENEAWSAEQFPSWECVLRVRTSVFRTILFAETRENARVMCRDISALRVSGDQQAGMMQRMWLIGRLLWSRRPQITLRSPVLYPQ